MCVHRFCLLTHIKLKSLILKGVCAASSLIVLLKDYNPLAGFRQKRRCCQTADTAADHHGIQSRGNAVLTKACMEQRLHLKSSLKAWRGGRLSAGRDNPPLKTYKVVYKYCKFRSYRLENWYLGGTDMWKVQAYLATWLTLLEMRWGFSCLSPNSPLWKTLCYPSLTRPTQALSSSWFGLNLEGQYKALVDRRVSIKIQNAESETTSYLSSAGRPSAGCRWPRALVASGSSRWTPCIAVRPSERRWRPPAAAHRPKARASTTTWQRRAGQKGEEQGEHWGRSDEKWWKIGW